MNDPVSEKDFINKHYSIKQNHIDFLKKIDADNESKALRILIDRYIEQSRYMNFEKYLPVFAFGLAFIIIGSILQNLYVSLTSIFTGVFLMGFSIYMYNRGRERYDKGD